MEAFPFNAETIWSKNSSVINNAHCLVSLVARNFNTLIFNNILLDNCISNFLTFWLLHSILININVRYETIVAWYMVRDLSSSNRKLKVSVFLSCCLSRQNSSWIVTMVSKWICKFSFILPSLWAIGLSVNRPKWSSWFNLIFRSGRVYDALICRFPMLRWIDVFGHCLSSISETHRSNWSSCTLRFFESFSLRFGHISSKLCRIEQLWVVDIFVFDYIGKIDKKSQILKILLTHSVHAFGWNLIISSFNILILVLVIDRLETPIIWQGLFSIWIFCGHIFIVISWKLSLAWFMYWIWLISI